MSKNSAYQVDALYGFISTGEKCALYTMRIMNRYHCVYEGAAYTFTDSEYVKILSNDKAKAETNALAFCEQYGLEFKGNAEFELNEIRRQRDAEAVFIRNERDKLAQLRQAEIAEEYDRVYREGVVLRGQFAGMTIEEIMAIDIAYVFWMADQATEDHNIFTVGFDLAKDYLHTNNIQRPGHVGVIGETINIRIRIARISWFVGAYGNSCVITAYDEESRCITFFTTSKKFTEVEQGTWLDITGVVKEHSEYRGMPQTVLKAPKIQK